jgi:cell division septation protein DedD
VATSGPWRLQLGAFAIRSNADGLWNRVKSRPEVAGRTKLMLPTGRVTRLMVDGFADQASAQTACGTLKRAGFECLATRN